jgi:hypothetical protein
MCVTAPNVPLPMDFSAPEKSGRTILVMERHRPEEAAATAKVALPPPPQNTRFTSTREAATILPANLQSHHAAGKILSDAEVIRLLQGAWRLNDGEDLVDITFNDICTFSSC